MINDDDKPILRLRDVYVFLHDECGINTVTMSSITHAAIRNQLQYSVIGKTRYVSKNDALAWLASRKVPAKA